MKTYNEKHIDLLSKEFIGVLRQRKCQDYLAKSSADSPEFCELIILLACIGMKTTIMLSELDKDNDNL